MGKAFFLDDKTYRWHHCRRDGQEIYGRGCLWHESRFYEGEAACRRLLDLFVSCPQNAAPKSVSPEQVRDALSRLQGHFAFVIRTPSQTIAAVDRIRSFPLFYAHRDHSLWLSNSARRLRREANLQEPNPAGFLEFEITGYVTGRETLFVGLQQLQAGEYLLANHAAGGYRVERYYLFLPRTLTGKPDEELIEDMDRVSRKMFRDTVESLRGRPAWIPLSAGLDSRWILAMLLDLKYDNIMTFSYGKKGHPEVACARIIAERLRVPWRPVYYTRAICREIYYSPEGRNYSDFADGLSVIPVYNDFYALHLLRQENLIPADAVFINGQSGDYLTGGHVPARVVAGQTYSSRDIIDALVKKHFSLWGNLRSEENLASFGCRIAEALSLEEGKAYTPQEAAQLYEWWEWQERQSKFVVNGQRVYEWFGYDWRLPLWHDELMFLWQDIPWEKRKGQKLHKLFLNAKNYGQVFNGYYMDPMPRRLWERVTTRLLMAYAAVTGEDIYRLVYKYEWYFANYAPFYFFQKNYWEYLRDSYWHESHFAYQVKDYLRTKRFDT